jgi:hypothetical protein
LLIITILKASLQVIAAITEFVVDIAGKGNLNHPIASKTEKF